MTWAEWLTDRRTALDLSQTRLGELVGVTQQQVSLWEDGQIPGTLLLRRLARVLQTTVDELLDLMGVSDELISEEERAQLEERAKRIRRRGPRDN